MSFNTAKNLMYLSLKTYIDLFFKFYQNLRF